MERMIPFEKYEASGNDFIIFDFFNTNWFALNDESLICRLCDRHFGIGADGVIVLNSSDDFDFKMIYYNSDGKPSSFCGNGSRSALHYMSGKQSLNDFSFEAKDGAHEGSVNGSKVRVKMKDIAGLTQLDHGPFVDSGSPHLILEVNDPLHYPVNEEGRKWRNLFNPEGVNVNFVHEESLRTVVATYERGVEAETLACGTGVTAVAYYFNVKHHLQGKIQRDLMTKGGQLSVEMFLSGEQATHVWLTGPARKVFSGFYFI